MLLANGRSNHQLWLLATLGSVAWACGSAYRYLTAVPAANTKKDPSVVPLAPFSMWQVLRRLEKKDEVPQWLLYVKRTFMNNSPIYALRMPFPPLYKAFILTDPELIRKIKMDPTTDKPASIYKTYVRMMGDRWTLLTANKTNPRPDYVRSVRKAVTKALQKDQVQRMNRIASDIVDRWLENEFCKNSEGVNMKSTIFDPAREMLWITFQVILSAGFEYTPSFEEFKSYFTDTETNLIEASLSRRYNPSRIFASAFGLSEETKKADSAKKRLEELGQTIINSYHCKQKQGTQEKEPTFINILVNHPIIREMNEELSQNGSGLSERQLLAEVLLWLFAGHDTTGFSAAHSLIYLAKYPECQEKLRQEVEKSDTTVAPLTAGGGRNSYLTCVIREAWRLAPVIAMGGGRVTGKAYTHAKSGMVVPAHATCFIPQYVYARDGDIFPEPDEFKPERWLEPTQAMEQAYLPFSIGPRNCPGQPLANAELYTTLPKIVRKYRLELVKEGHAEFGMTYKLLDFKLKATEI